METTSPLKISNVHAEVHFLRSESSFCLTITISDPKAFAPYYKDMHPEHPFIYTRIPGGDSSNDTFDKVMVLGDMERLDIDRAAVADAGQYRTNVFSKCYDDVQEALAAQELLLHDLYNTYSDVADVDEYVKQLKDTELTIPIDTNNQSTCRKWI